MRSAMARIGANSARSERTLLLTDFPVPRGCGLRVSLNAPDRFGALFPFLDRFAVDPPLGFFESFFVRHGRVEFSDERI